MDVNSTIRKIFETFRLIAFCFNGALNVLITN